MSDLKITSCTTLIPSTISSARAVMRRVPKTEPISVCCFRYVVFGIYRFWYRGIQSVEGIALRIDRGSRRGSRGTTPRPLRIPARQSKALEPSCGHDLPTGESPPARAAENGRNRSARVRDPCRAPYGSRCHGFVDPFRTRFRLCFPIARAVGALHGVSPPPHPRWASAGERSSLSRSHPSNFLLDRPATPD